MKSKVKKTLIKAKEFDYFTFFKILLLLGLLLFVILIKKG